MLEILQFYVSGFWAWLGMTVGIALAGSMVVDFYRITLIAAVSLIRGYPKVTRN